MACIYVTEARSLADVLVCEVKQRSLADLLVHTVASRSLAKGEDELWCFVDERSLATTKICWVKARSLAGLFVCFVEARSLAGWRKPHPLRGTL